MSVKPSVAMNAVRAPRPSSSALVATVMPCENSLTASGRRAGALQGGAHGGEHALGLIVRGARRLGGDEPAVDGQHRIGERPADIHAQKHHRRPYPARPAGDATEGPRERTQLICRYAASAAGISSVSARCWCDGQ